jgi:hypothetical protein
VSATICGREQQRSQYRAGKRGRSVGIHGIEEADVYEVVVFDGRGKRIAIDFDKLELDDKTRARDYQEPAVLFRKLTKMKVPGIAVDMGTHDLLLALGRHRAATAVDPLTNKLPPAGGAVA